MRRTHDQNSYFVPVDYGSPTMRLKENSRERDDRDTVMCTNSVKASLQILLTHSMHRRTKILSSPPARGLLALRKISSESDRTVESFLGVIDREQSRKFLCI